MDLELRGKGFLVLGASRGIGWAVARELHDEGAHVVLASRTSEAVSDAARRLGERASAVVCDVADPAIEPVLLAVGALPQLDGILFSSGGPPRGTALDVDDAVWRHTFDLLVTGPLSILRALLPRLSSPASIVFVTSSSTRQPVLGLDTSNVVRPCVPALVKTLARQLGPSVRVNSIAPGRIGTDRVVENDRARAVATGVDVESVKAAAEAEIPLQRYGRADEVGRVAAFLLSPASSYVTGESILVDGGLVPAIR